MFDDNDLTPTNYFLFVRYRIEGPARIQYKPIKISTASPIHRSFISTTRTRLNRPQRSSPGETSAPSHTRCIRNLFRNQRDI
ncbi:hypothetical protein ARMGADRAFT_126641 [Armillaria gallica]|uniref:Uncharacterized protein n=1 Tax=Armillaria gallica TaxID=47427 RepID=A0A2H3DH84_ARMGA|nr:hypothetical protein ARMGADRAFT_126641 [Armillaria gallica]